MLNQLSQFFTQIAPFAITGVIVSGAVQWTKQYLNKTSHKIALLVGASLVGGAVAYFVGAIPQNYFTAAAGVLASANLIYVLFVQWFETSAPIVTTTSTTSTETVTPPQG